MQHIIEAQQLDRPFLENLFKLADSLEGKRDDSLKGKIMATLFYEPSTRTRLSFESAMLRLGGGIISTENAREFSSAAKGESMEDTMRMLNHYADILVMRHHEQGSAARAAAVAKISVVNAGDGAGQHPTQALLDVYTVQRELGHVDGIHFLGAGDLKHGRTVRSFVYLLAKFKNVRMTFVSPAALKLGDDIKEYLQRHNIAFSETEDLAAAMKDADVVYQTRIQKERFDDPADYERLKGSLVITRELADAMKKDAIIMHPLPRVDEIAVEVDDSPHSMYFKQAGYGVLCRMALLRTLLA